MPATGRKDTLSTGVSAHGTMSENIELFAVPLRPHNRWGGVKALRAT